MTEPVRIHIRVPGTAPMPDLMALVARIEAAGFDGAGILDSQMIGRDTFVILGHAAAHTKRLQLFPAVTNPFTRHASVLASAIQTVAEIAPGRIKCVIGTGYSSASTIGRKPATLAEMRACIGAVKALLAGHSVDWSGTPAGLSYASGQHIPVLWPLRVRRRWSWQAKSPMACSFSSGSTAPSSSGRSITWSAAPGVPAGASTTSKSSGRCGPVRRLR